MRLIRLLLICVLTASQLTALSQERKMSPVINQSSVSITAPSISGDGSRIVYLSDYTSTGDYSMMMSENKGGWKTATTLPKSFNSPLVNYAYGHYLSFDGETLYFTSRRSGGKKYDIWSVKYKNGSWGRILNLGPVINSDLNDGTPSLTPDEAEIYFSRCTEMDNYFASGCDIYYSKKVDGKWSEPVALPPSINAANDIAPRILPDGRTLVYSTNKEGGKGKYDLYMSRKTDGVWSEPVPLDFLNTPEDDLAISMRIYGNMFLIGKKQGNIEQIMEVLAPPEFKPDKILDLNFRINRDFYVNKTTLILEDWETGRELKRLRIDSGSHHLVLNEGTRYHLLIQPSHLKRSPVSKIYDLREMDRPLILTPVFDITLLESGRTLETEGVGFQRTEPFISDRSNSLMDHITKMVKLNTDLNVELQLVMTNYMEDTLFVHEDMTEVRMDTSYSTRIDTLFVEMSSPDSLDTQEPDSVELMISTDSLGVVAMLITDTSYVASPPDTVVQEPSYILEEVKVMKVTKVYHNDRSLKEAESLRKRLQSGGVPDNRIFITTHREAPVEGREDRFLRVLIR